MIFFNCLSEALFSFLFFSFLCVSLHFTHRILCAHWQRCAQWPIIKQTTNDENWPFHSTGVYFIRIHFITECGKRFIQHTAHKPIRKHKHSKNTQKKTHNWRCDSLKSAYRNICMMKFILWIECDKFQYVLLRFYELLL